MTAATLTVCPKELCGLKKWGKGKVKRAIGGGAGLIFKGSGFYITDYRSEGYKAAARKDATPSGDNKPAGENEGIGQCATRAREDQQASRGQGERVRRG